MPVKGADDLETLLEAVGLKLSPLQMEPLPKTEAEFTAEMKLPFLKINVETDARISKSETLSSEILDHLSVFFFLIFNLYLLSSLLYL